MQRIRVLGPELANRIAAGEVIERPASVVKELVENAIDAGSTRVLIEIDGGGKRRIRVTDDGCGIHPEDLPVAFQSHSTSKISRLEDLERIRTLGFRGEALWSIAAVGEVTAITRAPDADHGAEIEIREGHVSPVRPAASPPGTSIEVRNLFAQLPARRKFLRGDGTEAGRVTECVSRFAVAYPGIRFELRHNDRVVIEAPEGLSVEERMGRIFGDDVAGSIVPVEAAGPPRIWGYVGLPSLSRAQADLQYFYVNGRWVRDRIIAKAMRDGYQGKMIPGRNPVGFLFIEVDPGAVDFNVHPTKTEVRFRDPGPVFQVVLRAVVDGIARAEAGPGAEPVAVPSGERTDGSAGDHVERVREKTEEYFRSHRHGEKPRGERRPERGLAAAGERPGAGEIPGRPRESNGIPRGVPGVEGIPEGREQAEPDGAGSDARAQATFALDGLPTRGFQVHDAYIVAEVPGGIGIVDQHALHEKVLYEEIRRAVRERKGARQALLVAEVVELSRKEMELLPEVLPLLGPLGFEIEPFGEEAVAVRCVPAWLGEHSAGEFLRDVLGRWDELPAGDPGAAAAAAREEGVMRLLACRRAVKAGSHLGPEEVESLLRYLEIAEDPRRCPHGRPTTVFIPFAEIERRFERR